MRRKCLCAKLARVPEVYIVLFGGRTVTSNSTCPKSNGPFYPVADSQLRRRGFQSYFLTVSPVRSHTALPVSATLKLPLTINNSIMSSWEERNTYILFHCQSHRLGYPAYPDHSSPHLVLAMFILHEHRQKLHLHIFSYINIWYPISFLIIH